MLASTTRPPRSPFAGSLAVSQGGTWFLGAAGLFLFGSLLFGGDLAVRTLAGTRLFPMAARSAERFLFLAGLW